MDNMNNVGTIDVPVNQFPWSLYNYNIKSEKPFISEPLRVYRESTVNEMKFNVLPDLPVEEKIFIKEYRVWKYGIEAIFDRQYITTMEKSPSHLTFISGLVHLQKMFYVYMCDFLDIGYDPYKKEEIKIWPLNFNIKMPALVTKRENISQRIEIHNIDQIKDNRLMISGKATIENKIWMTGKAVVIIL